MPMSKDHHLFSGFLACSLLVTTGGVEKLASDLATWELNFEQHCKRTGSKCVAWANCCNWPHHKIAYFPGLGLILPTPAVPERHIIGIVCSFCQPVFFFTSPHYICHSVCHLWKQRKNTGQHWERTSGRKQALKTLQHALRKLMLSFLICEDLPSN